MNKQKICIIGDGLAGLSTAIALFKENIKIDLYANKTNKNKIKIDNRTTAVSESSYQFMVKELNIKKNTFWPNKEINLYFEDKNQTKKFLNFKEKNMNFMYIFQNKILKKIFLKKISKKKNIKFIKKNITVINYENSSILIKKKKINYDLIILCIGGHSKLYNKITQGRSIKNNYNEVALTATVKHRSNIISASQFFLKEGPLAILPFSKNEFSIVWSIDNKFFNKNIISLKLLLNNKIKILLDKIKIKNIEKIQSFPIYLNLKSKYFKNNILILGDGLHTVHPMAGQGFNLVLRDIKKLSEMISNVLKIGLLFKNTLLLKNFYEARKPENTIFGLGIHLTNIFFKNNKYFFPIKKKILNNIGNVRFIKKISQLISDKGISI